MGKGRLPRLLAVVLVELVFLLLLLAIALLIVPILVKQMPLLREQVPPLLHQVNNFLRQNWRRWAFRSRWMSQESGLFGAPQHQHARQRGPVVGLGQDGWQRGTVGLG
jgi:predicted PurR-regulated permease PerM